METILIVGLGHHSRRIYYPILEKLNKYKIVVIDTIQQKEIIQEYLHNKTLKPLKEIYIDPFSEKENSLPIEIQHILNKEIKEHHIKGVIISTDPLYHYHYAKWALENNLSILMDKPITIVKDASIDPNVSEELNKHYKILKRLYQKINKGKRRLLFSVVSQRRYHKGFQKIKELLKEIYEETNCPPTSIQISHCDGQWRLPSEIVDIDYHSYNQGFGKCSHSGYHFLDIINFFTDFIGKTKKITNVELNSKFLRSIDFLTQITLKDYEQIFGKKFLTENKYSTQKLNNLMKNYGEIDAFINLAFKHKNRIILLGSINLIHNSFSQRGNLIPNKDLYKGNGRVRHETYTLQQGPFQCIQVISFQSKEVQKEKNASYKAGGEYHFDIYVFRNNKLNKKWKNFEKISIKNIQKIKMAGKSRGHQEDARMEATGEFLDFLEGKIKRGFISDFLYHENNVRLMAGIYKSGALGFKHLNSEVKIKYVK